MWNVSLQRNISLVGIKGIFFVVKKKAWTKQRMFSVYKKINEPRSSCSENIYVKIVIYGII